MPKKGFSGPILENSVMNAIVISTVISTTPPSNSTRVLRTLENLEISWDEKVDLKITWDFLNFPTSIFSFIAFSLVTLLT